jgi:alkylated DNA repair protein (DNA oxidative demethylase)
MTLLRVRGFEIHKGYLSPERQVALIDSLRPV